MKGKGGGRGGREGGREGEQGRGRKESRMGEYREWSKVSAVRLLPSHHVSQESGDRAALCKTSLAVPVTQTPPCRERKEE